MSLLIFGFSVFFGVSTLLLLYISGPVLAIFLSVFFFSAIVLYWVRLHFGSYTNLPFLLVFFSFLYGVSGPVSAEFFGGIAPIFHEPYYSNRYLFAYVLSLLGLTLSFSFHKRIRVLACNFDIKLIKSFVIISLFFALVASSLEILNLMRAGGFQLLMSGKAEYQSRVSDLTLTLPTHIFAFISCVLIGQVLQELRSWVLIRVLCGWFFLITPYLIFMIILGRRGIILSMTVVVLFSYFYRRPLINFGLLRIVLGCFLFFFMGLLYGLRANIGEIISERDYMRIYTTVSNFEFWKKSLSLGKGEFGAPFGNFNTYQIYGNDELQFGTTYLKGFTEIIPRFFWPDKPLIPLYEFRNQFFPEEALRGSIASTGYSSILEAFMNFGWFGIFFVYFFVGLLLVYLERMKSSGGYLFSVFYLMLVPYIITFSRSSFSMPLFWPLISCFMVYVFYISLNSLLFRR